MCKEDIRGASYEPYASYAIVFHVPMSLSPYASLFLPNPPVPLCPSMAPYTLYAYDLIIFQPQQIKKSDFPLHPFICPLRQD